MPFLKRAARAFGGLFAGSSVTLRTPQGTLQVGKSGASLDLGRFTPEQEVIGIAVLVGALLWLAS